jgi:molybdopterin molybdotransferase
MIPHNSGVGLDQVATGRNLSEKLGLRPDGGMIATPMNRILAIRDEVIGAIRPLGEEAVPIAASGGRFLAADVHARLASPPESCSAMDGYAVRAAEVDPSGSLRVAGTVFAGETPAPLGTGEAARIFTGAPLPAGADAVLMQEQVEVADGRVRIGRRVLAGENVRLAGEDLREGALALPAGTRLGARQLALLVAVGIDEVPVRRRPRVVVITTGDEIAGGRVPDSNGPAVAGVLRAIGAEVELRSAEDRLELLAEALGAALASADAVVTVGGVSVGERDHVAAAVARVGGERRVHGVPMKPGKPFLFALAGGKPVFGLPGSPSACLVALEVFARPALLALAGASRRHRRSLRVTVAEPIAGKAGRARFLWAVVDGAGRARSLGRDIAQVRGPALADALLLVPEGTAELATGAEVEAWLLDDDA